MGQLGKKENKRAMGAQITYLIKMVNSQQLFVLLFIYMLPKTDSLETLYG